MNPNENEQEKISNEENEQFYCACESRWYEKQKCPSVCSPCKKDDIWAFNPNDPRFWGGGF